jgi:hypothetical protein
LPAECNVGYGYAIAGEVVTCTACEDNSVSAGGVATCEATLCAGDDVPNADHSACVACDTDNNQKANANNTACGE